MAETPIVTNGQVDIYYTYSGFTHVMQVRCTITNPGAGTGYLLQSVSSGTLSWTAWVDDWVALLRPLFANTTTITQAILQEYDAGTYVVLDSYSIGLAGSGAGVNNVAGQATFTFRDAGNHLVKVVLLESRLPYPQQGAYSDLGAETQALIDSILGLSAGDIGDCFVGRGDAVMRRFIFETGSINKRIQRKRGLA